MVYFSKKIKSRAAELQYRILRLIGKLGGHNFGLVGEMNLAEQGTEVGIAWDTVKRIKFTIPFQDIKPEIYLGFFIFILF